MSITLTLDNCADQYFETDVHRWAPKGLEVVLIATSGASFDVGQG